MALKPRNLIDENDPRVSKFGHAAPPWLINYADLMTEMVCFFIILYALSAALNKNVQEAKVQIEQMIKEGKVAGQVKMTKEGLQITFEEKGEMAFFESGKADLTPGMTGLLSHIAPTLTELAKKFDILVEGHTDSLAAVGYGEYKPVSPNDTLENRAKNRRVVFFVKTLPSKFQEGE
ncbi:MAG: hypothetical protein HY747_02785 [Elusimicrobia bacterium]|nr:hypothetical protein [Elusimicrobiota bacterium]